MNKFNLYCIILAIVLPLSLAAQKPPVTKWSVKSPFEQKVFIENKGQYQLQGTSEASTILYGARQGGLQYYFTANSIWIKRSVAVKLTKEEMEQREKKEEHEGKVEDNDKEAQFKMVDEFHQMQFISANPTTTITSENEVSWFYNFAVNAAPIKAHAYKKLIYHNLYPGIDMEFYFPENKKGFEYSFIVHPGADVSQIKIQYPLNKDLQLNKDGNIEIKSTYGEFTDHAPITNQSGKPVHSYFSLNNSIVQFNLSDYDKTRNLVIDPWTITPTFVALNDAYDVDWDNAGNCYAYGGTSPWQLIKYNPGGTMLWSFTEDFTSPAPYYGGMAVDRYSGSSYLIEGFNYNGAGVIKVNQSGSQSAMFTGNQEFYEMWRVAFSKCTNHAVIAGGGTSQPSAQACYLDTNLVNLNPVNVLNNIQDCCHDMWGITLDNYGNCYMATVSTYSDDSFKNVILKLPLPNLSPTTWTVFDGYDIWEVMTVEFANSGSFELINGFNGMAMSNTNLFTYDSYELKEWNSSSGALINSVNVNPYGFDTLIYWAGLTSDDCDNIFAGSQSSVEQFNGSLSLVNTIAMPDTVFAVSLSKSNILYTAGAGFISATLVSIPSCNIINVTNNVTNATCTSQGSITVAPSGGTPPYKVVWNTTPVQTGFTATNLSPGTYVATISDSSCVTQTTYDTVKVIKVGSFPVTVNSPTICKGDSVYLTASGSTGYTWYPFTAMSDSTGDSVEVYPASTTTYFVVGHEGSCPDTVEAIVNVVSSASLVVTPDSPSICAGQSVTLTVSGLQNYQWSPSTGLNTTTGSSVIATPNATTTYTINATSSGGCKGDTTVTVVINPAPNVSVTPSAPAMCAGKSVTLNASGADTYQWSPSNGLNTTTGSSVNAEPNSTITYTIKGFNGGCSDSTTAVVTIDPIPIIRVDPPVSSVCAGKEVLLTANGGNNYQWSPATALIETTGDTVTATPTVTTTYSIIDSNALGCFDTTTAVINIIAPPPLTITPSLPSICLGQVITLTATGYVTYQWNPSNGLNTANGSSVNASPTVTTTYTITGTDTIGCTDSTVTTVVVDSVPTASFSYKVPEVCAPQQVQFTNTSKNGTSYLWNFGDATTDTARNPNHTYAKGGIYKVVLTAFSGEGCPDSVSLNDTIVGDNDIVVTPNAFIPGRGGLDEYYTPVINCTESSQYVFRVFNRWGQLLFSSNDPTNGWDGRFEGKMEEVGVYVYYVQFICGPCTINKKGNITLLK